MEKSSFFNSVSHDRRYSAEDWAAYFASFISNGVFAKPSNSLQVMVSAGMKITIKAGSGFINGYYYRNTTDLTKTLSVADGVYNRIDRIVLRWSLTDRNITINVLKGTVAAAPKAPALTRNAEVYELALADIYIGAGITAVTQSNITDRRANSSLCGFVTGVVDQFDFSTLTTQFEAFFAEYRAQIVVDYNSFNAAMDQFESDAQDDFTVWFNNLKYILDGDVAGHLQNEIDAINTSVNNIQTEQISDGSVTRAKLAGDALYSPITYITSDTAITANDIGKTYRTGGSNSGTALTLTQDVSSQLPIGTEIAFLIWSGRNGRFVFDGVSVAVQGNTSPLVSPTFVIEKYCMVAIKKILNDSNGDSWLLTGNVEVEA